MPNDDDDEWYEVQDELAKLVTLAYLERNKDRILLMFPEDGAVTIEEIIRCIGLLDEWQP